MTKVKQTILVTGGAGYIGSHTIIELILSGFKVVVIDNLDNGSPTAIDKVREITGCAKEDLVLEDVDLVKYDAVDDFFTRYKDTKFAACIHLAALKAVGESVKLPLHYYYNNVSATLTLLNFLDRHQCYNFVFSSSACVYGDPEKVPITEDQAVKPTNPYGKTKEYIEHICADVDRASPGKWSFSLLRYFNPIGAHPSGLIGEDPQGYPNNLLPFVQQVAVGRKAKLAVFGNDYDTVDGTGVRDYIHVVDLAKGHVAGLEKLLGTSGQGVQIYNLGTGHGVSVLQVVDAFSKACGKPIPYEIVDRRPGDIATCYADCSKANKELGWTTTLGIDEMCRDAWKWQKNNPYGFRNKEDVEKQGKKQRKGYVFALLGDK